MRCVTRSGTLRRVLETRWSTSTLRLSMIPSSQTGWKDPSCITTNLSLRSATRGNSCQCCCDPNPICDATRSPTAIGAFGQARELGRPVKAVVRDLSDDDLVIAQGQENNARRDLSFIEKATFAMTLEERGFNREKTIVPALSVDKTELSRLISIARTVPPSIIAAIGPAPKAGRGRWVDLAARLDVPKAVEKAQRLISRRVQRDRRQRRALRAAVRGGRGDHGGTRPKNPFLD